MIVTVELILFLFRILANAAAAHLKAARDFSTTAFTALREGQCFRQAAERCARIAEAQYMQALHGASGSGTAACDAAEMASTAAADCAEASEKAYRRSIAAAAAAAAAEASAVAGTSSISAYYLSQCLNDNYYFV